MTETILEAKGVRKRYQMGGVAVEALSGLDFQEIMGKFVAIMEP